MRPLRVLPRGAALVVVWLAAALVHVPGADAQPRVPRIGVLAFGAAEPFQSAFREGLRELGYVDGQSILIEWRAAGGRDDRLAEFAAELVRLNVDVLVAWPTPAVHAAKRATTTIPIASFSGDPVRSGLVASLARPGGNVTGVSSTGAELGPKRLQLVREILPGLTRVAVLAHATDPFARPFLEDLQAAGKSTGVMVQPFVIRSEEEMPDAFTAMARERISVVFPQGVFVLPPVTRRRVADLAATHRIAIVGFGRELAEAGGLLSYGTVNAHLYRRVAVYVDKILKGAKPADLPIEQPTTFELVVNLKTAKALGITVPQAVLQRADHVIQ